jgi:hypothetical protein
MKIFRVYFNRKREAPQVWSVDEGSQESEVNVINFVVSEGCNAHGHYAGIPPNDNSPSAWMVVRADGYWISNGVAIFYRNE